MLFFSSNLTRGRFGKNLPKNLAQDSLNIVNKSILRDPVPHLDIVGGGGYYLNTHIQSNIKYVGSHVDANFFDHAVTSKTYQEDLAEQYSKFQNNLGR